LTVTQVEIVTAVDRAANDPPKARASVHDLADASDRADF
jgi:hypothetical protein